MNNMQQRALALLEHITPETITSRTNRASELLCSSAQKPSHTLRPEQWVEGWCKGWAFAVPPTMATALDIQLTPRIVNRHSILEWTQGSAFDFHAGYTIYDNPLITNPEYTWGEALQHDGIALQVKTAIPASPAVAFVPERKATSKQPFTPSKQAIPRFCGEVTFRIYRPNTEHTELESLELHTVSHDAFVRILIVGLPES